MPFDVPYGRGGHWKVKRATTEFLVWTQSHPNKSRNPKLRGVDTLLEITGYAPSTINSLMWRAMGRMVICPLSRIKSLDGPWGDLSKLVTDSDTHIYFERV